MSEAEDCGCSGCCPSYRLDGRESPSLAKWKLARQKAALAERVQSLIPPAKTPEIVATEAENEQG